MTILALDFDGVICDGSREVFLVALATHLDLCPGSELGPHLARLRAHDPVTGHDFAADPLFASFSGLTPLGNRAEDFGVILNAIVDRVEICDQAEYDAFYQEHDPSWLQLFHRRFYHNRGQLRAQNREAWLALQPPFGPFVELLGRRAEQLSCHIVTAKDRTSVADLLAAYGIAHLFPPPSGILDKEVGVLKTVHLESLASRLGVGFDRITFIDDKVNHLERAARLGVRCVLAGWGFNGQREHDRARRLGFAVAELNTVADLFRAGPGDRAG